MSQPVSERESEVLAALGERLSNAQIARRLHISVRTVESHVSSLLRKLSAADRAALADLAPPAGAPIAELVGLPTTWTSFVGRARELATVRGACDGARLVTIVGPGGVGKTRLATAVAADLVGSFPAGGVYVDLVPVREGFVVETIAAALGVSERPHQPLLDAVLERLRRGRSLLVLDNCEHLLGAVTELVEAVLLGCPAVTVLATSRERLGLAGERPVPLAPLATADEATALFLDRARAVAPDFTADPELLDELCLRLDRVPLAIELAAARAASLGVDGLLAGLDDHLRLLTGGRGTSQRHQSLRAVMDWSFDLLDADERALFGRLGVFSSGFDLDAAVVVAPSPDRALVADLVGRLTDKSLLTRLPDAGASRWRMLETVRGYAAERLADDSVAFDRYIGWATTTAHALVDDETDGWRHRFDAVVDDLRSALRLGIETDRAVHPLARDLARLSYGRRFFSEARHHFEQAARCAPDRRSTAQDLRRAADVAMTEMRADLAYDLLHESAEIARAAGDVNDQADAVAYAVIVASRFPAEFPKEVPAEDLRALLDSVRPADYTDRVAALLAAAEAWTYSEAKCSADPKLAEVAVEKARTTGDPALISGAMDALGTAYSMRGHLREAHHVSRERLGLVEHMSRRDPQVGLEISDALHMASVDAIAGGDLPDALETARLIEQDDVARALRHYVASKRLLPLALQGHFDEALHYAEEVWESWESAGRPAARWMTQAVYSASLAHGLRGADEERRLWRDRSLQVLTSSDTAAAWTMKGFRTFGEARIALHRGDLEIAVEIAETGIGGWYDDERWFYDAYAWAVAAEIAVVAGLSDAESRLTAAAPLAEENLWAKASLARTIGRRDGDVHALRESVAGWERIGARFERACTLVLLGDEEGARELAAMGCALPAS